MAKALALVDEETTRSIGTTYSITRRVLEKILESGPLRVHFQHSGAKIRVFEQNTKFGLFWDNFQRKLGAKFM